MNFTSDPSKASTARVKIRGGASQDLKIARAPQSSLDEAPQVGKSGPATTVEAWVELGEAEVPAVEALMRVTRAATKAKAVINI